MATEEEDKIDAEDAADEADAKADEVDAAIADAPKDESALTEEEALSQPAGDAVDQVLAQNRIDEAANASAPAPYAPGLAPPPAIGAPPKGAGPSEIAARDAVDRTYAADQRAAGAAARVTPEIAAHKEAQAAGHDLTRQTLDAQAKELQTQALAQQAGAEKAHAIADDAEKKYRGFKFRDFFTDAQGHDRTLARIFSAFAVGLGGFAAGPNGHNQALENIHRAIDLDFKKQEHELNQQKTFAEWSKEGEKDLLGRHAQERQTLLIKQGKALDAAAEEAKAQILRNGGSIEEAQNDAGYMKLKAAAEAKRQQGLMGLAHLETQRELMRLRPKPVVFGGAGLGAMEKFAEAAGALEAGAPITPEIVKLGHDAGLKPNQIAVEAERYRGSGTKSALASGKLEAQGNAVIKDPWSGAVIGPAPNARSLTVARNDQANGVQLVDALSQYRDFLRQHGTRVWGRDDVAEAEKLWANAASQRRVWSKLPSSESGLDLEKAQMGGKPLPWDVHPTSEKVIDEMVNEVRHVTKMRANILAGRPVNYEPPTLSKATGGDMPSRTPVKPPKDYISGFKAD